MRHCLRALLLFSAVVSAPVVGEPRAPAPGQDASDIVVTGNRDLVRQAHRFVDTLTRRTHSGQLASFRDYVCPAVQGMREPISQVVVRRMRRVAAAAGLRVAPERCSPNLLLIVVADKRAALRQLRREAPGLFGDMSEYRISALISSDEPAAAWPLTEMRGAGGEVSDGERPEMRGPGWRLSSFARIDIGAAIVVIQASIVVGVTPTQIADYATMRSFVDVDTGGIATLTQPSILTLFQPGAAAEAPLSVTQWDISFLRALSATRSDLPDYAQRGAVAHAFTQDLARSAQSGQPH